MKFRLLLAVLAACSAAAAQNQWTVITGGTLIDVHDGKLVPNSLIVIEGDRIKSVSQAGKAEVPASAQVIDATGKYVIPGLIDFHVHHYDWACELFLAHGVTSIVDLGNPTDWILAQKEGTAKGKIRGPRVFGSGNVVDGPSPREAGFFLKFFESEVSSAEEARELIRKKIAEGSDAIKVYDALTPNMLRGVVVEANRGNIPVVGHFKDARDAIQAEAHGIEHTAPVAASAENKEERERAAAKARRGFQPPVHAFIDFEKLPAIVRQLVEKNIYLNPTLRGNWQGDRALREKGFPQEDYQLLFGNLNLQYIPLNYRLAIMKEYNEIGMYHYQDLSPWEQDLFHTGYQNTLRLVKMFVDAGGKLYAGTDTANMSTPGLSMHQELELIAEAGVPPLKALQAATLHPAGLLRKEKELGTIEPGKLADIVVLGANPLENIRNTRKVEMVLKGGEVQDISYHADYVNAIRRNVPVSTSHIYPSPIIKEMTPRVAVEGAPEVDLTLRGTGFIPYSKVQFNGTRVKTEFVDRFELRAQVPAQLLNQAGTFAVTVANPEPTGTTSSPGASDIAHLGVRGPESNEMYFIVKFK